MNAAKYCDLSNPFRSILEADELDFLGSLLRQTVDVDGNVLELGCYMGGTSLFMADTLAELQSPAESGPGKVVYGLDTFDGFPVDDTAGAYKAGHFKCHEKAQPYETLVALNHPKAVFLRGAFRDTLPKLAAMQFSLVFFDCDILPSIVDGFHFIGGRMASGGIAAFHDYGYEECPGVKKFVDGAIIGGKGWKETGRLRNLIAFTWQP